MTPVVLVGHSGGGAIIHGAVDARPDRVVRAIYVDSGPLGEGGVINDELPDDGDDVPLPPWELFEDEDLTDLDEELRAMFRARAIPQPKGVAQDQQRLHDERRYDVPATVIACEFPSAMLIEMIAAATRTSRSSGASATSTTWTCPPGTGRSSPGRPNWARRSWPPSTGRRKYGRGASARES